jgi:beta-lactamase superfamily II metal-dependent hydrolase
MAWTTGRLQIQALYMGKGDCTVITLPDGKHIMVDAGSNKCSQTIIDNARNYLVNTVFKRTGAEKKLHALILTHADKDHINKVPEMCGTKQGNEYKKAFDIGNIYFGDLSAAYLNTMNSPMYSYSCNKVSSFLIREYGIDNITCVSLNSRKDNTNRIYKWKQISNGRFVQRNNTNNRYTLDEPLEVASGTNWSVHIIAGNNGVIQKMSNAKEKNAASLVVLVQYKDGTNAWRRFLVCGDANTTTEQYLMKKYKDGDYQIKENISVMMAPHHGSSDNCSTEDFISFLEPKAVIFSSALQDNTDHHPRKIIVERYRDYVSSGGITPTHKILFWELFEFKKVEKLNKPTGTKNVGISIKHEGYLSFKQITSKDFNATKIPSILKAKIQDFFLEIIKGYNKGYARKYDLTLMNYNRSYVALGQSTNDAIGVTSTASNGVVEFLF